MSIVDFFDPNKEDHMTAYAHLQETGAWPEGFIPADTTFPSMWNILVVSKIADCWIDLINYKMEKDKKEKEKAVSHKPRRTAPKMDYSFLSQAKRSLKFLWEKSND